MKKAKRMQINGFGEYESQIKGPQIQSYIFIFLPFKYTIDTLRAPVKYHIEFGAAPSESSVERCPSSAEKKYLIFIFRRHIFILSLWRSTSG